MLSLLRRATQISGPTGEIAGTTVYGARGFGEMIGAQPGLLGIAEAETGRTLTQQERVRMQQGVSIQGLQAEQAQVGRRIQDQQLRFGLGETARQFRRVTGEEIGAATGITTMRGLEGPVAVPESGLTGMGQWQLQDLQRTQARRYQQQQFQLQFGTGMQFGTRMIGGIEAGFAGPVSRRGVFAGVRRPQMDFAGVSTEPPEPEYDEEGRLVQQPMREAVRQEGRALRMSVKDAVISSQNLSIKELGQLGLGERQFMERWLMGGRAQQRQAEWGLEDIERQRERGLVRLGWQEQDLRTGYGRGQQQFGWQAEDLAFRGAQQSLGFGWQMEDIEEGMRYATGRQRRRMMRQRERATIQFGMGMGQLEREDERLQQRRQWADEDFAKELDRINIRRGWLDEDYDRAKSRLEERTGWNEELHQLSLKHHHENMELAIERANVQIEHYNQTEELQAKSISAEREFWKENATQALANKEILQGYTADLDSIRKLQDASAVIQKKVIEDWNDMLAGMPGYITQVETALESLLAAAGAGGADLVGDYDVTGAIE
jgi:hypothetical protein